MEAENGYLLRAAQIPTSLKQLLALFPLEKRLDAIRAENQDGDSVLHLIARADDPSESFIQIASLLPQDKDMQSSLQDEVLQMTEVSQMKSEKTDQKSEGESSDKTDHSNSPKDNEDSPNSTRRLSR